MAAYDSYGNLVPVKSAKEIEFNIVDPNEG